MQLFQAVFLECFQSYKMNKDHEILKFKNVRDLITKISRFSGVEATKQLTRFYSQARFKLSDSKFEECYVDGKDDGGIDLCYKEQNSYYLFQTKFTETPKKGNITEIKAELNKINKTINTHNPNKNARKKRLD